MTKTIERPDDVIEGRIGPFYVALNRATLFLASGLFLASVPYVAYAARDASPGVRYAIEIGTAIETGTLLHIIADRVYGWPRLRAWALHAATAIAVFGAMVLLLH